MENDNVNKHIDLYFSCIYCGCTRTYKSTFLNEQIFIKIILYVFFTLITYLINYSSERYICRSGSILAYICRVLIH